MTTQNMAKRLETWLIGVDIGSTTTKIVLMDFQKQLRYSKYLRHNAEIYLTVLSVLHDIHAIYGNIPLHICITGSIGMGLAETCDIPFLQEVVAATGAVKTFFPETQTLIDVGGEDSKLILFDKHMRPDIRMNNNCAGGTGAFIDQMVALLDISLDQLNDYAADHNEIYPIASRCGVFAKTDIQNLLSNHAAQSDIAASIFHAVAIQTINTLAQGSDLHPRVLFCGGPLTFLPELRNAFVKILNISHDDVILPQRGELLPALGTALMSYRENKKVSLNSLIKLLETKAGQKNNSLLPSMKPLFQNKDNFQQWKEIKKEHRVDRIGLCKLNGKETFLGIDAGSTTTKLVLCDEHCRIAFTYYTDNNGRHIESVQRGLQALKNELQKNKVNINIKRTAVTGYGEDLIRVAFKIDDGIVETLAHFRAAQYFNKNVSFVLDIGGQDMKAIFIKNGIISNIEINEACSSGCGSFIDTFAHSLGYKVSDFARIGCESMQPSDLGTRCTVFMNSKVKQSLREGAPVNDISAGLAYSVIKNCLNKVLKINDTGVLGEHIVVQGGTFRNDAVFRAFELLTDKEVIRPDICELMGAYGASLYAREQADFQAEALSGFVGLQDLQEATQFKKRILHCHGCENSCRVTLYKFNNEKKFYSGQRCENIYTNSGYKVSGGENLFALKNDLLFSRKTRPSQEPLSIIGIPRVLNMYENFPFWCTLLVESGCQVVLSSPSSQEILEKGAGTVMSDNICFPAKLSHGHFFDLIEKGVDRIFYPIVKYETVEFESTANTYNCPVVTGYPEVIRNAVNPDKYNVAYDTPTVVFNDKLLLYRACSQYLQTLGIKSRIIKRAFIKALEAQISFKQKLKKAGKEILNKSLQEKKLVALIAGRPYHMDSFINHKIPEMISKLGMDVIPDDAIPYDHADIPNDVGIISQWSYPNRLLAAANWAGDQENVFFIHLNSFGCGPDALIVDEVKEILQQKGKISTFLRIDEVSSQGSIKLRIRSLLESIKKRGMDTNIQRQYRRSTRPFLEADKTKTIIIPDFAPGYSLFIAAVLSQMGYNVEVLPSPDRESVEWGLKYTNNEICYPAIICVGDVIKALKSGNYIPENTVTAISETGGQCRASNYAALLKKALCKAGFDSVPVITISLSKQLLNEQPGFKIDSFRLALVGISSLLYIDLLFRMYYTTAAREINRGQAKIILDKYLHIARTQLQRYSISKSDFLLAKACQEFNTIETRSETPPRIGIVGEIYLKYNPFSNYNTVEWLLNKNVEVIHPPLLSFFLQDFINIEVDTFLNLQRGKFFKTKTVNMLEHVANRKINKSNNVLHDFRHDVLPIDSIRHIANSAEKVLSLVHQYGEGWLIAGEIATMAELGINNIICLQPFGCIANHIVAKGIGKKLKSLYPDLNLLYIDAEAGSTAVNIHNRLHFLLDNAQTDALIKNNENVKEPSVLS